ncbi:hypothetical protein NDU88_005801 [Pleurodeles waltl]|uniref:Uncharacterized protein n=1 Tax=Pleurodeles waltl TaxID=8319 RepID=A0AAV7MD60_PLEWA|nr:hypothetical protein NDU88_005801 [Pleurodeles waltl]
MLEWAIVALAASPDTHSSLVAHRKSEGLLKAHKGELEGEDTIRTDQNESPGEFEDDARTEPGGHRHCEAPHHIPGISSHMEAVLETGGGTSRTGIRGRSRLTLWKGAQHNFDACQDLGDVCACIIAQGARALIW